MSLRVAVLAPFGAASARGNAVTVARIARGLGERGLAVRVWDLSALTDDVIAREVDGFRPEVIHAFHAYRTGPLGLRLARRAELPLVVTITGTDGNGDLFDAERAALVRRVLEGARTVVVFHASMGARIAGALPDVARRLTVVPQAVRLVSGGTFELAACWPALPTERLLVAFPAGIRPVKRPCLPLEPLDGVAARRPELRLLYVGPVLDPREGARLDEGLRARPWARHIGPVDHAAMGGLLARADVVLNCSESEGGMANSVLEAFALGRAVLASDIEGNRSLVEHGVTGLLFADAQGLADGAERLAGDPVLRARLGAAGRALVEECYPPESEIEGHLEIYRAVAAVRSA